MTLKELFHLIAVLALWALAMTGDYNEQVVASPSSQGASNGT